MTKHEDEAQRVANDLVDIWLERFPEMERCNPNGLKAAISAALAARDAEFDRRLADLATRAEKAAIDDAQNLAARDMEIERLKERCVIYEGHNKTYQDHIKVSSAVIDELRAQVERMRGALLAYSNILHSLEARGIALSETEDAEWERLTCVEQATAATAKEPQS